MLTAGLAAGLLVTDKKESAGLVTEIRRNDYGGGSAVHSLQVTIDGKEQEDSLEINVEEKRYTKEEINRVFDQALKKLEPAMLGKNISLDEVRSDLNLVTEIPGEQVEVSWELDRYDLMTIYGELNEEELEEEPEGALVNLKAYLTYTEDESMQVLEKMSARVYPPKLSGTERQAAQVKRAIAEEEERSREEDVWYVLILGPVICLLLVSLQKQNEQKEKEAKERQMMLDYPEIMNKLTLLIGAGMTVKKAWVKIVQDYEKQKDRLGIRYAYEEMAAACREMQSGVAEIESYERFGKRCGMNAYRKLASLLEQNLRKGTKGLTALLGTESEQAFEERKASAKRRGEEAGTKLLAPMFFMLAMVLVIVIIPAFLSIQT